MTRLLALSLALASTGCSVGCSSESKASAPAVAQPAPRNFVCERLAIVNPKATCVPEMSSHGDLNTHTARVTIEKDTLACALNAGQVSLVCAPLVYVAPAPVKAEPAKPPEAKKR